MSKKANKTLIMEEEFHRASVDITANAWKNIQLQAIKLGVKPKQVMETIINLTYDKD